MKKTVLRVRLRTWLHLREYANMQIFASVAFCLPFFINIFFSLSCFSVLVVFFFASAAVDVAPSRRFFFAVAFVWDCYLSAGGPGAVAQSVVG